MHPADLLKAEAEHLGFSLSGWVSAAHPPHYGQFAAWVAQGFHGEMAYLARPDTLEKRADPRLLLDGARSILCLAYPYLLRGQDSPGDQPGRGSIAGYACRPDYHIWLTEKVDEVARRVNAQLEMPFRYRVFTDSAPILERDLAWQAGLGWIARNGCLIHPRIGSAFLLAELVTDLEPPAAAVPVRDHCGSCQRCLAACPTGCIRADRTIDARRCISYLTIEYRGHIPAELRPLIGSRVFGCDECQLCCPWVQKANRESRLALKQPTLSGQVDIIQEFGLTAGDFKIKNGNYPIARAKWAGYMRNLAVAAGNLRLAGAAAGLTGLLMDNHPAVIRAAAAWALGQIGTPATRQALGVRLDVEQDPVVLAEIQSGLESG
jgi:epoxyqueuosine reductase